MKEAYTIPETERENVLKLLNRYSKKAMAYGQSLGSEMGEPYAKEISVYQEGYDERRGCSVNEKVGNMRVEAFDLTIDDGGIIRKEGYTVVAKIEHLEGGNIVYTIDKDQEPKLRWSTIKPRCEHCGGNHGQKTTFIVRNDDGDEKQVGRTCLMDYCGIDPQRIGLLNQLEDMFLDLDVERYDFVAHPAPNAYETMTSLALALRLQKQFGYTPSSEGTNSNKAKLQKLVREGERPTEREYAEAEEIAKVILSLDRADAFQYSLDNAWMLLRSGYCKFSHFGYIAYAPLAYERYEEAMKRKQKYEQERVYEQEKSGYVGSVGQRLNIDVSDMKLLTSWEGEFGYTYLYKFTDATGNVLVWYASKTMENARRIRATIKAHTEYNGVKQTIVTRCAVVEK